MNPTIRWCGGTNEEYETQLFGFGVQRLQISVRQMVEQKITCRIQDMYTSLQERLDANETDKDTLSRSCNELIQLYYDRAGPSLENIDKEIERMLSVPPNTLLPEDEVHAEHVSDEDYEKLRLEVIELRKRVERGALMEALLKAEEEELKSAEEVCEIAKKDMDILDLLHKSLDCQDAVKNVLNNTQSLCTELPFFQPTQELFEDEH